MDISNLVFSDDAVNIIDNGAWVGNFEGLDGVEFFVRGTQSDAVQAAIVTAQADARMRLGGKDLTVMQYLECRKRAIAEAGLLDWRGLTSNGEEVKYSKDLAIKWLTTKAGRQLGEYVGMACMKVDEDAESLAKAAEKN